MPKVTINDSQGLVQSTGSGVEISSPLSTTENLSMSGGVLSGDKKSVISTGRILTAADSGALILADGGSAQTFTLPSPAAGVYFKMYAAGAFTHKLQVSTGLIYGNAINTNNQQSEKAEGQKVEAATAVAFGVALQTGDFMEIVSNGVNWFLHAVTNDPLTITT